MAYIQSTKIPGLSEALNQNFAGLRIGQVAAAIASQLGTPELEALICAQTGFTNFYKAYRNSARGWVLANAPAIAGFFQRAYDLKSDADAQLLATDIAALAGIPKANHPTVLMRPEYLLTPVCFALDPRLRFPIINGATRVQTVLQHIGAADQSIAAQVRLLAGLIGQGGILDAADLDQLGLAELHDLGNVDREPVHQLLTHVPEEGDALPLKDEDDVRCLQQALEVTQRRVHNRMTNQLREMLASWTLLEGRAQDCRYDVLVKNYNRSKDDLLIEVKSSATPSHIRMAIGQVYSYQHRLVGPSDNCHTAILVPERPDGEIEKLLSWLDIGLLWLEDETLHTATEWLEGFVASVPSRH
ncbi:hypothetical protein [Pseudomonas palleroniana]